MAAVRPIGFVPSLILAPALAWLLDWWMPSRFVPGWVFVAAAAATAVLVVMPVTAWLIDHDRLKVPAWLVAGVLAGLAPALLGVFSATLGLWYRGGWTTVRWVYSHGAPIPGLGRFTWMRFLTFVGWSCLVGVAATLAGLAATRRDRVT